MRSLEELRDIDAPAWPQVQEWIRGAAVPVEVLAPSHPEREASLEWLQVTTRSPLGTVAYETGGLLVDHGWLRVLGSGHARLPRSILGWNRGRTWTEGAETRRHILLADDVVGGHFAIDCGGLGFEQGKLAYFAPDTCRWEALDSGYSDFLTYAFSGRLAKFYADYRWDGWEKDVEKMGTDRAFALVPPPFLKGEPFSKRSRGEVPIAEHYGLYQDFAEQLRDVPDGTNVILRKGIKPPT